MFIFPDFLPFDMNLLLLTVTLRGVSNKHCLLSLFSFALQKILTFFQQKNNSVFAYVVNIYMYLISLRLNDLVRLTML